MGGLVMEAIINEILYYVIWVIEIIGIGIIAFGTFYSAIKLIIGLFNKDKKDKENGSSIKLILANYLALGLEFMLAAEILRTVTMNRRDFSEIIVLGAIIILRAAISLLIYFELSYEEKKEDLDEKKNSKKNNVKPL